MHYLQGIGNFNLNVFEQLRKFCRKNYPAGALPSSKKNLHNWTVKQALHRSLRQFANWDANDVYEYGESPPATTNIKVKIVRDAKFKD